MLPEERLARLVPGPLSLAGIHHLVTAGLGSALPRPQLTRLAEASGGNPSYALEIARELAARAPDADPGEPLPLPPSLQEPAGTRIGGLSETGRQAVLAAAALSRPTVAHLLDGTESDARATLVEAEEAGVLVSDHGRIRFTHPLLASAVCSSASPERRRQVHERLAAVVSDPEERARHLALSATDPDEAIATQLEEAAPGGRDAARSRPRPSCTRHPVG